MPRDKETVSCALDQFTGKITCSDPETQAVLNHLGHDVQWGSVLPQGIYGGVGSVAVRCETCNKILITKEKDWLELPPFLQFKVRPAPFLVHHGAHSNVEGNVTAIRNASGNLQARIKFRNGQVVEDWLSSFHPVKEMPSRVRV
jgi:hypothetical protein